MAPRIEPLTSPTGKASELLAMVAKKMGRVPNMMKTLAHSPAALEMYLMMSGTLSSGAVSMKDRERLALLAAAKNECAYCDKAHTAIGKMAGLTEEEVAAARGGDSSDEKSKAMLAFSTALMEKKGHVGDEDLHAVRRAGVSDGEILELVAITCLNIYTNYVNHVANPEIDF